MLAALLASALIGTLAKDPVNLRGAVDGGLDSLDSGVEVPDVSGLPDTPGPYQEEPNNTDADKPKPAMLNWTSQVPIPTQGSLGSLMSLNAWQEHQFCNVHKTGFFCNGDTRIRCCKLEDGYAKCGSTANFSACDSQMPQSASQSKSQSQPKTLKTGAGWWYVWHIHPGWHVSSFCRSHHVGSFCSSHHRIHCCNDHGHYVECNSQYHDFYYC